MLRMHREYSKTSMCILKLDNQVTKLDQDAEKSFCLLRFEINGTSVAEDLENFAMFSVHSVRNELRFERPKVRAPLV